MHYLHATEILLNGGKKCSKSKKQENVMQSNLVYLDHMSFRLIENSRRCAGNQSEQGKGDHCGGRCRKKTFFFMTNFLFEGMRRYVY